LIQEGPGVPTRHFLVDVVPSQDGGDEFVLAPFLRQEVDDIDANSTDGKIAGRPQVEKDELPAQFSSRKIC
jgi:hypothetical protein